MANQGLLRGNRARADFLHIDSQIALTFSSIALQAGDSEKRTRNGNTARKAYDAIMRLRKDIDLTVVEDERLDANLRRLKSELQSLGQTF